jgi:hypothetical protein
MPEDTPPLGRRYPNVETKEPEFPNLSKAREFDFELHVRRGIEAGLTPEQARRHALDELKEREREGGRP